MNVVVDGITYVPAQQARTTIGIGITTRNRRDMLEQALEKHREFMPPNATLVIVDDASDTEHPETTFRFTERAGVAQAKNKCLELLDDAGVEHFFLFDDDTWPIKSDWWKPYVDSPEPHLMFCFPWRGGPPIVAQDAQHTSWAHPCGPMLYVHRSVLSAVGGMDTAYGTWGHEHVDYSNRIHNAGLTVWRFADVTGSEHLLYCADQKGAQRSVSKEERDAQIAVNVPYYESQIDSAQFKPYRAQRNVVLTAWQHGPDRQRSNRATKLSTAEATKDLRASIRGADLIVFGDDDSCDICVTDLGLGMYLSRWVHFRRWLAAHPEVQWVWMVDANDVKMLHEPWAGMKPGVLYEGHENSLLAGAWMLDNHKAAVLQNFFRDNASEQLLNCGVIGGDRATVMEYLTKLLRLIEQNSFDRWQKTEEHDLGLDMGSSNYVARTFFKDRLVWGSQVATAFKAEETNSWSWWKHK